jgi:hypothetical protein
MDGSSIKYQEHHDDDDDGDQELLLVATNIALTPDPEDCTARTDVHTD